MSPRYRLRGEVGGVERSYLLAAGPNRIGSIRGNDIVLPVRGVSRRHAVLSLGAEPILEDLGSKNGTLVNDARIGRARLAPGDTIRFGPVGLRMEEVEGGDADLAIVVHRAEGARPPGLPVEDTTSVLEEARSGAGAAWLGLVERFLARLRIVPEEDLVGATELLVRELPAVGACVVEWTRGGEPAVLAASGRIESPLLHPGFQEFFRRALAETQPAALSTAILPGDPVLSCALLSGPGSDRLALVVWGEFRGRAECEPLLRTLLCLLDRFRPRPLHAPDHPRPRSMSALVFPDGYVAGESPAMTSLYGQMRPLVQGDLPVLILGETGVGKEYLARILHASSGRRGGPFVAINCAAIPAELLEAEMFGISKGVATGVGERPGRFQLAEGGTLFLDEIGDMPLGLQAKLLRALQEKEIQPVGGAPVAVDIRVITATNTDLERSMQEGRFRRDLYYRVAGYALHVPPLRERREDIPVLVEEFVRAFSREAGKSIRGVTVRALRALVDNRWPGNVRELEHEIRRLVYLCPDGQALDSTMLSPHIVAPRSAEPPAAAPEASLDLEEHVKRLELPLIREALGRAGGNRTHAAKLLGISRNGLAIKMARLGITD